MTAVNYIAQVPAFIDGIPCLLGVTRYFVKCADRHADNDMDFYGYTEVEYDILDRKGYKADWLSKKVSRFKEIDLQEKITEYMGKQ